MSLFFSPPPHRELTFSRAIPSDLDAVARFIARLNDSALSESLHCPRGSAAAIRGYLRAEGAFLGGWDRWFYKGVAQDGRIVALLGCQPDPLQQRGWLWGPWHDQEYPAEEVCPPLLKAFVRSKPHTLTEVEAFLNLQNQSVLGALKTAGYTTGLSTHLYTATAPDVPGQNQFPLPAAPGPLPDQKGAFPLLRTAHEIPFLSLHAEAFPAAPQSGQMLLDARDDTRIILAAANGLRLLGYVCVSINHAPLEGFIDYVAVKTAARGRGVGRWLLTQAQRWIFEEQRLPQASLCVTNWRTDARRLYESTGFRLQATGVAARTRYR